MPILVPNSSASDGLKDLSAVMICAQLNLTALDLDRNFAMIRKELQNAKIVADEEAKRLIRENKVGYETFTILALPDMTITGPGCGDAYLRPALLKATMARLLELERLAPDKFVITLGVPIGFKGKLYKANAFICDGALRGFSCATLDDLSPRDDLRQFAPWERDKIDFICSGENAALQIRNTAGASLQAGSIQILFPEIRNRRASDPRLRKCRGTDDLGKSCIRPCFSFICTVPGLHVQDV